MRIFFHKKYIKLVNSAIFPPGLWCSISNIFIKYPITRRRIAFCALHNRNYASALSQYNDFIYLLMKTGSEVGGIAKLRGDLYLLCLRLSGQAAGLPTGFRQKT